MQQLSIVVVYSWSGNYSVWLCKANFCIYKHLQILSIKVLYAIIIIYIQYRNYFLIAIYTFMYVRHSLPKGVKLFKVWIFPLSDWHESSSAVAMVTDYRLLALSLLFISVKGASDAKTWTIALARTHSDHSHFHYGIVIVEERVTYGHYPWPSMAATLSLSLSLSLPLSLSLSLPHCRCWYPQCMHRSWNVCYQSQKKGK